MFDWADFKHKPFARLRKSAGQKTVLLPEGKLLLSGPGRNNPLKRALCLDLRAAQQVQIISSYFLPPWRIRRELARAARRGAKVQLILPAKTDVPLSLLAARSFYRRFLGAGVEIYEYLPQVLHAKAIIIDDLVYTGSANLDSRSLNINYELLLRLHNRDLAAQGRKIFAEVLTHCRRIDLKRWRKARSFWEKLKARAAYILLARVDPSVARYQWRGLKRKKGA
jgi:cardiolipin synthase